MDPYLHKITSKFSIIKEKNDISLLLHINNEQSNHPQIMNESKKLPINNLNYEKNLQVLTDPSIKPTIMFGESPICRSAYVITTNSVNIGSGIKTSVKIEGYETNSHTFEELLSSLTIKIEANEAEIGLLKHLLLQKTYECHCLLTQLNMYYNFHQTNNCETRELCTTLATNGENINDDENNENNNENNNDGNTDDGDDGETKELYIPFEKNNENIDEEKTIIDEEKTIIDDGNIEDENIDSKNIDEGKTIMEDIIVKKIDTNRYIIIDKIETIKEMTDVVFMIKVNNKKFIIGKILEYMQSLNNKFVNEEHVKIIEIINRYAKY